MRRQFRSFHEIAGMLDQAAADHPDENIYFILAGWQTLGYDHAHPAACPPNAEAGGWDGMREVSDAATKHGFLFGVHDQYPRLLLLLAILERVAHAQGQPPRLPAPRLLGRRHAVHPLPRADAGLRQDERPAAP